MKSKHGIIHLDETKKLFEQEFGGKDSKHDRDKAGRYKGKRKPAKKDIGK